ncbi:unnamed protein product [Ascophyllum nodosum]
MAFYAYVRITSIPSSILSVIGMTMFRVYSKFSCWKICNSLRAASKTGRT